uniref:F-box protein 43 n=1 Tax=Cyprinodon variegatus TaxID=28743 RepID=A0A3Q2D2E0_CYPVA
MQCTPKSNVNLQSYKGQHCYEDCSDSGYSGWFQSPQSISGGDISGSLSPSEICETPKENLRLHVTPKEQSRGPVRVLGRDNREAASVGSWCETPKLNRRGPLLRHKLLTSKPALVKTDGTGPTFPSNAESCLSKRPEHWLSASFNSLDLTTDGATGGSNMGHDAAMSGRKRRLLFSQMRTSTREDGKPDTCMFSFEGGVVSEADFGGSISLNPGSLIYTPLFTQTPKDISGFSSLTLDKSQDSSVDHDGSFQELLGSASKGINGTPNLNAKRPSRLQRHHRLSTLKEGGSQSEEDSGNRLIFAKNDSNTPLSASSSKTSPADLSLTPALQLVHAICQQRVQRSGQSPSLREELKLTAALVETPVMFRTTMPLAGMIGRKMGLGELDILTELKKRNLRHILANIFSKLNPECLYRCGLVCKSWNEMIHQDHHASLRRMIYMRELEEALEVVWFIWLQTNHRCFYVILRVLPQLADLASICPTSQNLLKCWHTLNFLVFQFWAYRVVIRSPELLSA